MIHSTRADLRLLLGLPAEALADAELSLELLTASEDPNPYVLGATVRADVQARMALGQLDDARDVGEGALSWLGDRVPQTRSLILSTLASSLRDAGRVEEAYDALERAAELERQAFQELSELQLRLERATLEASAARDESAELAAKNRQLADAHAELELRAAELEALQEQLRDQAERDWLTGLHNRRYFARELQRLSAEQHGSWLSLAIVDLDHFKSVNDEFGHEVGDRVLVRVAALLCEVLRQSDVVVRSGGEEFLVLMPATEMNAATACCERIRRRIRERRLGALRRGSLGDRQRRRGGDRRPRRDRGAHARGGRAPLSGQARRARPRRGRASAAPGPARASRLLRLRSERTAARPRGAAPARIASRSLRAQGARRETSEALWRCDLPVAPPIHRPASGRAGLARRAA